MKESKLIAEAERLVAARQLEQALRTYKKVLKTKPGHGRVNLACARIAFEQGDSNLALRYLKIAQKSMAERHEYFELLGDLHRSKSEWSAAKTAYESCQEAGADRLTVLIKLASLARAQGQIQTALNHYQSALSIDENFALAQIGIGEVLESIGQPGHALRWYSRASSTDQGAVFSTQKMRKLVDAAIQRWHFPMMNDGPRNNAFNHAITETLTGVRLFSISAPALDCWLSWRRALGHRTSTRAMTTADRACCETNHQRQWCQSNHYGARKTLDPT